MFTEKSVSDDAFGVGVERDWPKYGKLRPHVRHRFSDVLELEVARINLDRYARPSHESPNTPAPRCYELNTLNSSLTL